MSISQSRDIKNEIWVKADDIPNLIFVVKEEKFPVNKKIISKSPILSVMLNQDTEEKDCESISIENVEPSVFFEILYFLYYENVKDKNNLSFPLCSAAEKFGLHDLKQMCEEAIVQDLNLKNVLSFLIQADAHKAESLKKKIISYIVNNARKLLEVPEFKMFFGHMDVNLILSVFDELCLNNNP